MTYHVDRITLEPQPAAVVAGSVAHDGIGAFLSEAFEAVQRAIAAQGAVPAGPPFARYVMTSSGWDIEAGFPVTEPVAAAGSVQPILLPGGTALAVLHRGPYVEVGDAYHAAEQWMAEHDWSPTAPPWEVYLDEPETAVPRTIVHLPARPV